MGKLENMACCNFPLSTTFPSTFVAIRGKSRKKKERKKEENWMHPKRSINSFISGINIELE